MAGRRELTAVTPALVPTSRRLTFARLSTRNVVVALVSVMNVWGIPREQEGDQGPRSDDGLRSTTRKKLVLTAKVGPVGNASHHRRGSGASDSRGQEDTLECLLRLPSQRVHCTASVARVARWPATPAAAASPLGQASHTYLIPPPGFGTC